MVDRKLSAYGDAQLRSRLAVVASHDRRWGTLYALMAGRAAMVIALFASCCTLAGCDSRRGPKVYPHRPIKLVVPFGPGGGTDIYARIIEKAIEDQQLLPVPLVIINLEGAGATIGSRRVKNARPDGYTMMVLHDAILTAKYSGTVNYGPEAFEPIAATGEVGMIVAVRKDSPYHTLNGLLEAAKLRPAEISFGVNRGAVTHFAGLQLEHVFPGARFNYPQSGGGADRLHDLQGGHIDVTGFSLAEFVQYESFGLRGLAYFGPQRHAAAPQVPTALEQGIDVASSNTFYWWVPRGTPDERIDVLADALERAMQSDYVRTRMAEMHTEPIFIRGPELEARINRATRSIAAIDYPRPRDLPNFPLAVAVAIALLLPWVAVDFWRRRVRHPSPPAAELSEGGTIPQRGLAVICLAITVLYALSLASEYGDFRVCTMLYVMAVGWLLSRQRKQAMIGLVVLSLVLGFGVYLLFTSVFSIDLPTFEWGE